MWFVFPVFWLLVEISKFSTTVQGASWDARCVSFSSLSPPSTLFYLSCFPLDLISAILSLLQYIPSSINSGSWQPFPRVFQSIESNFNAHSTSGHHAMAADIGHKGQVTGYHNYFDDVGSVLRRDCTLISLYFKSLSGSPNVIRAASFLLSPWWSSVSLSPSKNYILHICMSLLT